MKDQREYDEKQTREWLVDEPKSFRLYLKSPTRFALIFVLYMICAGFVSARAAQPTTRAEQRDGRVLNALLSHLLSDPEFEMAQTARRGATIVLHARTPDKIGVLMPEQMRQDVGTHSLPGDAERDLLRRNSPAHAKPDTYDAVTASFSRIAFSSGIVVADLTPIWKDQRSFRAFEDAYPKARGYLRAYLPGYSQDGVRALVRAEVGPSPHGATLTALLEKSSGQWKVKWHYIAAYV